MADRLAFGLGAGLEAFGRTMAEQEMRNINRRAQTGESLLKDYTDRVMKGELDPEQASKALASMGIKVPSGHFETLQPDAQTRAATMSNIITKAGTQQEIPTPEAITTFAKDKRLPLTFGASMPRAENPGMQGIAESGNLPSEQRQPISPFVDSLLKQREEKLNSFAPTQVNRYDANSGAFTTDFIPSRADQLTGVSVQTQPTPQQAGQNKLTEWLSNEGSPTRAQRNIDIANLTEKGTRAEKVATTAAQAGAGEEARLNVELAPKNVQRRVNEAVQRTIAEARARQDVDAEKAARDSANAAGQLMPFLDRMVALSKDMSGDFGPTARLSGLTERMKNIVGMSPTINAFDTEVARNIRPLAVAMGIREANVSDTEAKLIRDAIGIRPGMTREERYTSLQRLRDMITIGPIVAGKLGPNADVSQRLQAIESLSRQRRDVENQARAAGANAFQDPATGAILDVIQY